LAAGLPGFDFLTWLLASSIWRPNRFRPSFTGCATRTLLVAALFAVSLTPQTTPQPTPTAPLYVLARR
jgi:hypothetical protein